MADTKTTNAAELSPEVLYSRVTDFQRRVAANVNDLQHELSPKVVANNAKRTATGLLKTPDGKLKTAPLVIAGATVAAVVTLVVLKRKK